LIEDKDNSEDGQDEKRGFLRIIKGFVGFVAQKNGVKHADADARFARQATR
jgi:hypothetical protein